jgi:hypothetical protein
MDKRTQEILQNELDKSIEKVSKYPKGFEFTINYTQLPSKAKENGMRLLMDKLCELGYLESIAIGHSLKDLRGESGRWCTEETFRRI